MSSLHFRNYAPQHQDLLDAGIVAPHNGGNSIVEGEDELLIVDILEKELDAMVFPFLFLWLFFDVFLLYCLGRKKEGRRGE